MKKIRFLVAMLCMAVLMCSFAVTANAQSNEPTIEQAPVATPASVPAPPGGTGTVVEQSDEEGREFYTIMTPDENVFYLVIDRQRGSENVYFLNAVTEVDLLPLAELPVEKEPAPTPVPTPEPEVIPEPETEKNPDIHFSLILAAAVLALGFVFFYVKKRFYGNGSEEDYDQEAEDYKEPAVAEDFSKWFDEWEKK